MPHQQYWAGLGGRPKFSAPPDLRKPAMKILRLIRPKVFLFGFLLSIPLTFLIVLLPLPARGQAPAAHAEAGVARRNESCPDGHYAGPRPGKARYTKDSFLWVVSPEFARKFCMPERFVSTELKGALAVAFRIVENAEEALCGMDGRQEFCMRGRELRFEIFLPAEAPLPKRHALDVSERPSRPALRLIEAGPREQGASRRAAPATRPIWPAFEPQQFGLNAVQDGAVVQPTITLLEEAYNERVFEGVKYLALQGPIGYFGNPRLETPKVKKLAIVVRRLGDTRSIDKRPMGDFAHVIELPESFTEQVREADRARALGLDDPMSRRAVACR